MILRWIEPFTRHNRTDNAERSGEEVVRRLTIRAKTNLELNDRRAVTNVDIAGNMLNPRPLDTYMDCCQTSVATKLAS